MDQRYNEMNLRNVWHKRKLFTNNDLGAGRCLAAYALGKWTLYPQFLEVSQRLKEILGDCICMYNPNPTKEEGLLHQTLLQFVRFYCREYAPDSLERSSKEVATILEAYSHNYTIEYTGLVWTPTGIALSGYSPSEQTIIHLRDEIEKTLGEKCLPCEIPYKNDILHATFFRWIKQPSESQLRLLEVEVENNKNTRFGRIEIKGWLVGEGSWRMQDDERKDLYIIYSC